MVTHLNRDFLLFEDQYKDSERFWRELVADLAKENCQEEDWKSWMPKTYWNGTPVVGDGNPIFEARSDKLRRAFRIMQRPPLRNDVELSAWMDRYDYSGHGGPGPTDELNIGCALSEEAASIVRALIALWMDESITVEQMKRAIDSALVGVV